MKKIIALHKEIKKELAELKRAEAQWEALLEKTFLIEDIIKN